MADYSKMKNVELETLLKERGLAHTGKKADLVKRLQDSDASGVAPAPASSRVEDEIDWDDEPATTDAKAATSEPAAAAIQAGGTGQPPNPTAVPNQVVDTDPAPTNDLQVASKPAATEASGTKPADGDATVTEPVKEKTPVDFSSGMAATTLDEEIAKRKARAKKFGMDESKDETLQKLERQKRFGGDELPSNLNSALPDKRERKRGREAEDAGDARKRGRPGIERRGSSKPNGNKPNGDKPAAPRTDRPAPGKLSDVDRAAAEKRKAKWAATTPA